MCTGNQKKIFLPKYTSIPPKSAECLLWIRPVPRLEIQSSGAQSIPCTVWSVPVHLKLTEYCESTMQSNTKSLQLCLTLCDPMDCSPPGSSVHGIFRQEYWNGLPFPSPGDLPDSGTEPMSLLSPALAGRFFTTSASWEAIL